MNPREFLETAEELVANPREADWRSGSSRAYYAAFHVSRDLLRQCGFDVPAAHQAHSYLCYRLQNCGHPDISEVGRHLESLRKVRNRADYDLHLDFEQRRASDAVSRAEELIDLLDQVAENDGVRARITAAVRDYERDVLKEITWRSSAPGAS